jgi:hypothetical protein
LCCKCRKKDITNTKIASRQKGDSRREKWGTNGEKGKGERAKGGKGTRNKVQGTSGQAKRKGAAGSRDKEHGWYMGQGSEATMSPVIANAVKQSRRKTPTNSPVLDCFVPRNDEKVQGAKGDKGQATVRQANVIKLSHKKL